jgi:site-specific DNA-cytosine methylase
MNALSSIGGERVFRHGHMACGIGAGAKGFNMANPRVGNMRGRFECAGGIDVDEGAIRNFQHMTGVKGTVMDLFDEDLYRAFHDKAPPRGWRPAAPEDIRAVFGRLDILFASYPCKGFSGLLSSASAETAKYQALNGLTLRGMMLSLEAYKDDPVAIVAFENVPRIATKRGAEFLAKIDALYRAYGYIISDVEDSIHNCGEIGGLAQSRKRFLRLYRHPSKVPNFIYQPEKKRLRGVGEVIGKLPMPGDPAAGIMHRVPSLQWKTWVRLAFVPAGKDWRALNELAVIDGRLRDFGILPERELRDGVLGVMGWDETASTTGTSAFAVADPRPTHGPNAHTNKMRVVGSDDPAPTITGSDRVGSGALSVADPRPEGFRGGRDNWKGHEHYGVIPWSDTARSVTGSACYDNGRWSVADPRAQAAEEIAALPEPGDRGTWCIISPDGTRHRPFTTLELAALQSLFDPEEAFDLEGGSDAMKREWIGNAVPSQAARGMAEEIGEALLLASLGETFTLSTKAIWVSPYRMALAVDTRQPTDWMDA